MVLPSQATVTVRAAAGAKAVNTTQTGAAIVRNTNLETKWLTNEPPFLNGFE